MASTTGQDWFNTIFGGLTTAAAQLIPAISNAANGGTTQYNPATGLPYMQTNSTDTAILSQMAKDAAANKQTQTIALIGGAVLVALMVFNKK